MKFRLGACAAVVLLAACSGQNSDSQMAALHGSAGGDSLKSQARGGMAPSGRDVRHSIANAPDRGTLMAYQNQGKPVKREGAFTYYPVSMSEDHALKGVVTGHMTVPMPDGSEVKLNYERHDEGIDGNWTWVGRVEGGDPMQEAIITFGEEAVFASIPQGRGEPPLNIRTQGGSLYAVQMDPSKVRSPNVGHNDMAVPEASTLRDAVAGQVLAAKAQVAQNAVALAAPPSAANTIDVVVGYTAGFRNKAQLTQGSVTTALTYLLQIANQGFSNSNINGYLRLVNAQEVAYTDSNSNQLALHELTGSNGTANVTIPAALTPLRTARDQYGADVALLIRGFQQPEHQGCGIAWLIGANGANVDPVQDARWGYGVVSFGDDTGTDGNSYYCAPESMIHEVGHLLGSAHDQANSTTPGRYPYSYGYKSTAGNFYTIMAYGDQGQTPYRIFSNPNLTTCGGNACGIANSADNARSLNQTIPVVVQFRATVVPHANSGVRSDFNGDGRSDIVWTNATTQQASRWFMQGPAVTGGRADAAPSGYRVVGVGDFDGDGRSDLLWVNATNTTIVMWRPDANGSFVGNVVANYPAGGWVIAGIADMNGDGLSDIVWSNSTTQQVSRWYMNGPALIGGQADAMPTGYRIVGLGDFDGDNRADILWANTSNTGLVMWRPNTNNQFVGTYVANYPAGNWTVAGISDMNGDGFADIVWTNPTTQQLSRWYMNGSALIGGQADTAPPSSRVVGIGDFDGDGRGDVLWANNANTSLIMWRPSSSNQFVGSFVADYPAGGWNIVMGTY